MGVSLPTRWATVMTGALITLGVGVRAFPLLAGDMFRAGIHMYDDGVYVAAAALFVRGATPYHDFVLVHPPGLLLFLSPIAWLEPARAYAAARWLFVGVGAINLCLTAVVERRWLGAWPAVVAVATYALLPDVVVYERGAFLEPLLNLGAFALLVLARRPPSRSMYMAMGVTVAAMCCVKLTGALWAVPVAWWLLSKGGLRALGWSVVAALVAGSLVAAPFALHDPVAFFDDIVRFHLARPPDGGAEVWRRVFLLWMRSWALIGFFGFAVFAAVITRTPPTTNERTLGVLWSLATLALVGGMLAAKTFWIEYSSALGPLQAIAMALSVSVLLRVRTNTMFRVAMVALALGVGFVRIALVRRALTGPPDVLNSVQFLQGSLASTNACVTAMEPAGLLALNRLPAGPDLVVDTYGDLLVIATRNGGPASNVAEAFARDAVQARFRAIVSRCEWSLWGWRGDFQSTHETRDWARSVGDFDFPVAGGEGISVFHRK